MKKIEVIIKPFKLDDVKEAVKGLGLSKDEVKYITGESGAIGLYKPKKFKP